MQSKKVVAFDISKQQTHHVGSCYKTFSRYLRSKTHNVVIHGNTGSSTSYFHDELQNYDLLVIANPTAEDPLSQDEISALRNYLQSGKSILLSISASSTTLSSSDSDANTYSTSTSMRQSWNSFLDHYGIQFENDCVVQTVYTKYYHPKQVMIKDGALHETIFKAKHDVISDTVSLKMKTITQGHSEILTTFNNYLDGKEQENDEEEFPFVYPHGCTINVHSPSIPILSSGSLSFPANRPIGAAWEDSIIYQDKLSSTTSPSHQTKEKGRLVVLGSADIFSDEWLSKEQNNNHLLDTILQYLLHENDAVINFDRKSIIESKTQNIEDVKCVPDIEALSERLKSCLQENQPLPQDISRMYYDDNYAFHTKFIPRVKELYKVLNVKHEPLSLIPPDFERPIPPLTMAVFPPKFRSQFPPPALDQFDLDEEFAESEVRLARLTNRFMGNAGNNKDEHGDGDSDESLECYILEAAIIVGLGGSLVSSSNHGHEHFMDSSTGADGKKILFELFQKVTTGISSYFSSIQLCIIDHINKMHITNCFDAFFSSDDSKLIQWKKQTSTFSSDFL